jgi:hypothetical protein
MGAARGAFAALAFLLATVFLSSPAAAAPQWCEEDPEFLVNGALVDVTTSFPGQYAATTSEVHIDMQVPSNAVAVVLSLPGTVPVTASISRTLPAYYGIGSVPVVVTITMKTTSSFQHTTTITGLGGTLLSAKYGWSTWPAKYKFYMWGAGLL